ncbi:MAG: response regulator [Deltaproteobacteria bacterium]|nr:response regulator [Deltaproteobacteria bacterium]
MSRDPRPRILCVDDEPRVLEAIGLNLRRRYEVVTATGGGEALEIIGREPPFVVIMSDMRMPGMDGAAFLARARELAPDATRLLLTGYSEMQATIAAVNQGRIFRFLAKPCPPAELAAVMEEAVEQHRLVTAERVLLEQTLRGVIQTLVDVLTIVQPASFGVASRIKQLTTTIATRLGVVERWPLEVAALLSQLGTIALPPHVSDKLGQGEALTRDEQAMVERASATTERLLAHIPRLDLVRGILASAAHQGKVAPTWSESERQLVVRGGQILHAAGDFAALEARGEPVENGLAMMRGRHDRYQPDVLEALTEAVGGRAGGREMREVGVAQLRVGMVLADEMRTQTGALLCPRGYEVTESFVERLGNFRPGIVREPIRVFQSPTRAVGDHAAGAR